MRRGERESEMREREREKRRGERERERESEYQHGKVQMVIGNLCILVLWMKVGLSIARANTAIEQAAWNSTGEGGLELAQRIRELLGILKKRLGNRYWQIVNFHDIISIFP